MSALGLVLAMGASVYALRAAGFLVAAVPLARRSEPSPRPSEASPPWSESTPQRSGSAPPRSEPSALARREEAALWARGLGYVPVALLAALVATSLGGAAPDGRLMARLVAAAVATLVVWRTRRLWACIASGLAVYQILRWLA